MLLNSLWKNLKGKIYPYMEVEDNSSVSALLKDRPEIAELLKGHDDLKRWLIDQFSGKVTKIPIQWRLDEPETGGIAECSLPRGNEPAEIRVSRHMSGPDQLSGVIFELFNIQNHRNFCRLWKKACRGQISKKEYSYRCYRLEYKALKKCKRVLQKHAAVFAAAHNSDGDCQRTLSINSFRDFWDMIQQQGQTYFEKVYEERIAPYRKQSRLKLNKRDAYLYRHGPNLIMYSCLGFAAMLSFFQLTAISRHVVFLMLPLCLLLWLIYMPAKNRMILFQFYYRIVACLFLACASASVWLMVSRFIEESQRSIYRTILTYSVLGILGILIAFQIFTARCSQKRSNKDRTVCSENARGQEVEHN